MKKNFKYVFFIALFATALSCKDDKKQEQQKPQTQFPPIARPAFNGANAYNYVQKQVDFGPRVPGTPEHKTASEYLVNTLGEKMDSAFIQTGSAVMYNGNKIPIYNIIGQLNPERTDRILLAAHWDTRHIADRDANVERQGKPILGANDGASGVGVLLEIASQLKLTNSNLGVDIIFFDAEDLGDPIGSENPKQETWCLGSQYWAQNPHTANYRAKYGILLDMVGAQDAVFKFENYGYQSNPALNTKIWNIAHQLGYNSLFVKQQGGSITDDHVFVMKYRNFPMIDIIDFDQSRSNGHGFGDYHHTHSDDMSVISEYTLQAVGETVLAIIND